MSATSRTIRFTLNGQRVSAEVAPHMNLVELLQERFGLYGARESCGQGLCGCCTVLVDGKAVSGCLYFAVNIDGKAVTTVEALDAGGLLSKVQQAFIDAGAFQCGFCTPGQIVRASALVREPGPADERTVRLQMSGNVCRCTGYTQIVDAVLDVWRRRLTST